MSLTFKNESLIDSLDTIIDNLRETGTFTSAAYDGTYTTFVVSNDLSNNDTVTINDNPYLVKEASSTGFKVKGNLSAATAYKAKAPYFMYGHILEITNILAEKTEKGLAYKYQNYPVIMLPLDVISKYERNKIEYERVRLIIANKTRSDYIASERKVNNFEQVLYPLYQNLITEISKNPIFDTKRNKPYINHKKTDRFFWGTQLNGNSTANITKDYLDAIEITELNLIINRKNC